MKKLLSIAALVIFLLWAFQVLGLTLAIRDQAQKEEARPSDMIVVLGAAEYNGKPSPVFRSRLDHAYDLYRNKMAPRILTTGGSGGERVHTEAEVGRQYLANRGIPVENIYVEIKGATTAQSTAASAEILKRMGMNTCILVSDGYHLFRAKKMMESYGLDCVGSPRQSRDVGYLQTGWLYMRQAVGYSLFDLGLRI